MKRPARRFVEPPVFVSQSSSWLTYMLFEEESSSREDTTKGWRRDDDGGEGTVYTRGIPNDFGSFFGTATRDRGGPRRRGPKSCSTAKRSREGPRTRLVARAAFFAFNLLPSRLLFGPDGEFG